MTLWPAWPQLLAVALGAGLGGVVRLLAGTWLNVPGAALPVGTLLVNAAGGLLVGAAMVWFEHAPDELLRLALVTGFLGGLTTFSAFSAESLGLLLRGQWLWALGHTLAHVAAALACAALGYRVLRALLGAGA
jgi:CrcB protein